MHDSEYNDMDVQGTSRKMPWNRLRRAAGIAPLRGEAATRSEQATGGVTNGIFS